MALYLVEEKRSVGADGEAAVKDFIGQSTDTKPTDVGAGSTFIEGDTQTVYVFDGTTWRAF